MGVDTTFFDMTAPETLNEVIQPNTRLVWVESPTNLMMKDMDIPRISEIIKRHNQDIIFVVDNTFLTPYFQEPTFPCISLTKYMTGHSDVIMGAMTTNNEDLYKRMLYLQNSLPSHPHHSLAKRLWSGSSGMMSFYIKNGNLEKSNAFLSSSKVFILAESLGGFETLAELPSDMTLASVLAEQRAVLGITDSMIRLSIGLEDANDLIADLDQALAAIKAH
uniref:cystathionine gamma-lyase n=1 Tax=Rhodnius prolixus TaxID=13249 RepID=T1I0C4_RHOPR